jgi:hypothetical protein
MIAASHFMRLKFLFEIMIAAFISLVEAKHIELFMSGRRAFVCDGKE